MIAEEKNVQLIKDHFAAFGRGDVKSAISMIAENVDWQSPVTRTQPEEITWAAPRHNRQDVVQFFQELASKVQPEGFEILGFIAQGDQVVVEGRNRGRIKATGFSYEHDWVMVFTVLKGKIVRHRHYYDTADVVAAFRK